jgi:hypothetical protein
MGMYQMEFIKIHIEIIHQPRGLENLYLIINGWLNVVIDYVNYTLLKVKKHHKGYYILDILKTPPKNIPDIGFNEPPIVVQELYKPHTINKSTIDAYKILLNLKYNEWITRKKPLKVEWVLTKPEWIIL